MRAPVVPLRHFRTLGFTEQWYEGSSKGPAMTPARREEPERRLPGEEDPRGALSQDAQLFARRWRLVLDLALKDSGQTFARWRTLHVLKELGDGASQRDLASAMGIEEPGLVRLLDALEAGRLLQRKVSRQDRRSKLLALLPAGRQAVAAGEQAAARLLDEVFEGIAQADVAACARVFRQALAKLDDERAGD